jgi:hypothetical protein
MRFSLLLLVAGCPWIGAKDLDQRLDADGDGFEAVSVGGNDCDDTLAEVHPGAPEVCNGIDDDCDGLVDPDGGVTDGGVFYVDSDGDGFGAIDAPIAACQVREGLSLSSDDCDDTLQTVSPNGTERCNDLDDDCDGDIDEDAENSTTYYVDTDGDGAGDPAAPVRACEQPAGTSINGLDCAPDDPNVHPGTNWYTDGDNDGYGADDFAALQCEGPPGTAPNNDDCDDSNATLNPDTSWYADTDGDTYGDPYVEVHECLSPGPAWSRNRYDCDDSDPTLNPDTRWYIDSDGDGFEGTAVTSCLQPFDSSPTRSDCDDTNPLVLDSRLWWLDDDGDGWGGGSPVETCIAPTFEYVDQPGDCDDTDRDIHPESVWALDEDADGFYADGSPTVVQCEAPANSVLFDGDPDCNDADASVFPGAHEICDAVDSDCDGSLNDSDAELQRTWYRDDDGDGYGEERYDQDACAPPSGYAAEFGDCEPDDPDAYPGAADPCYDDYDSDCADNDDFDCDGDGYAALLYGGDDCNDLNPLISPENPGTRTVPAQHATLQEAIDLSCPNDTIFIEAGTFTQTAVTTLPLHFVGVGSGISVLDGDGSGPVLSLLDGGSVTGLTLMNGTAEEGGCIFAGATASLVLDDLHLVDCVATRNGGAIFGEVIDTIAFTDLHIERAYAPAGGGMYLTVVPDGTITDLTCTDCEGASGGSMMFVNTTLDIDRVWLDHPVALASNVMAINAGGLWTNWALDAPAAITPGLTLVSAGGLGTPLVIDGLDVWQPAASAGGTSSLWSDGAVDLTVHNLTQIGGEDAGPYLLPMAVRVGVLNGSTVLSNLRIVGSEGPTVLITGVSSGRILLDQSTLVRGGGLVIDAASSAGAQHRRRRQRWLGLADPGRTAHALRHQPVQQLRRRLALGHQLPRLRRQHQRGPWLPLLRPLPDGRASRPAPEPRFSPSRRGHRHRPRRQRRRHRRIRRCLRACPAGGRRRQRRHVRRVGAPLRPRPVHRQHRLRPRPRRTEQPRRVQPRHLPQRL